MSQERDHERRIQDLEDLFAAMLLTIGEQFPHYPQPDPGPGIQRVMDELRAMEGKR